MIHNLDILTTLLVLLIDPFILAVYIINFVFEL